MFINIRDPSDTRKGDLRRAIRSQAALSSATCRKNTLAAKAASGSSSADDDKKPARRRKKSRAKTAKEDVDTVVSTTTSSAASESAAETNFLPPQLKEWNTRSDPFRTYPTSGVWHTSIPRLVDTYITHFATEKQDAAYSSSRSILRTDFWPEVLSHSTIFFTNLLIATSHQSFAGECSPEVIAWFRHRAVRSIQEALEKGCGTITSDHTITAVALLCGWELEYGDDNSFQAHMHGLRTMVQLRGGLHGPDFSPIVRQIILSVTHNLLLYAGMEPVFEPMVRCWRWTNHAVALDLPEGFAYLKTSRLVFPATLDYAAELNSVRKQSFRSKSSLSDLHSRLLEYDYTEYLPVDYCPLQSGADDAVNNQAEKHIKLALLCIICRMRASGPDMHTPLHALLDPARLVNTVYAEVGLWALLIICSVVPFPSDVLLRGLKRLLANQGVTDWPQVTRLLHLYFYPGEKIYINLRALWEQLTVTGEAERGQMQLSRYNVGVFLMKDDFMAGSGPK